MRNEVNQSSPFLVFKDIVLVRLFGWNVIGFLIAFLINNFLTLSYDFPGVIQGLSDWTVYGLIQVGIYLLFCLSLSILPFCINSNSPPSKVEGSDNKRVIDILRTGG